MEISLPATGAITALCSSTLHRHITSISDAIGARSGVVSAPASAVALPGAVRASYQLRGPRVFPCRRCRPFGFALMAIFSWQVSRTRRHLLERVTRLREVYFR